MNPVTTYSEFEVQPRKFGGWLLSPSIGVILGPLLVIVTLFTAFLPIFTGGTWEALTNVSSEFYLPYFGSLMVAELVFDLALLVVSVYLAYLFFNKRSSFPKWYAGITVFSLVFLLVDAFAISVVVCVPVIDVETIKALIPPLLGLFIWVPYLYKSKRSKETFIR